MDTKSLVAFHKVGEKILETMMLDTTLNIGLIEIERDNYFRITKVNKVLSSALNIRFDENGKVANGGDDFLMYIPWDQRRDMYDDLETLEIGESVKVNHALVGRESLLQNCKGTFFAIPCKNGEKLYLGVYSSPADEEVMSEDVPEYKVLTQEVYIQTKEFFDIYVNNKPISFKNTKVKELLEILVRRRGAQIAPSEAIELLWPGEEANKTTLARYRKVVSRMESELRDNGIEELIRKERGNRRIDTNMFKCDLFGE